jgi:hypothetical protein
MAKQPTPADDGDKITITAPHMEELVIAIRGTAPLCVNNFSNRRMKTIRDKHEQGSQAGKGKQREARDFNEDFEGARHRFPDGGDGFNASAIRNAMISACRVVGFKMTLAKLSLFVIADGYDRENSAPLVRIIGPVPEVFETMTRTETGVINIATRPLWHNWGAYLRIKYDAAQFSRADIANLIQRVGAQVGICEGRPDSKNSAGIGFGTFEVVREAGGLHDLEATMSQQRNKPPTRKAA